MRIRDYIRSLDADGLRESFRTSIPFPFIAMDGLLRSEFAAELASSYPEVSEAEELGRTFRALNESGKTQVTDAAHFGESVSVLNEVLADQEWLDFLSHVTGIPKLLADEALVGGGMHLMRPESHLDVHIDFNLIVVG